MAAVSSMRLLVVCFSAPFSSLVCPVQRNNAPQPPGPGLPRQAPSVNISIFSLSKHLKDYVNIDH